MTTTYVSFAPSPLANFQFQATLDGGGYTVATFWNLYAQRYYLSITASDGALVLSLPLIASPDWYNINLTGGVFFETQLVFRQSSQNFEIAPLGTAAPASAATAAPASAA